MMEKGTDQIRMTVPWEDLLGQEGPAWVDVWEWGRVSYNLGIDPLFVHRGNSPLFCWEIQ